MEMYSPIKSAYAAAPTHWPTDPHLVCRARGP
jgi:hypothetical protein